MEIKNVLFVGMYPNNVNKYCNVFFQNLIFAIADQGVNCTVISPVSITKYRTGIRAIPKETVHYTPCGAQVKVYYPRYCSASSKQIFSFNTEHISEALFERSALKVAKRLTGRFDAVYGHFFLYGGLAAIRIGKYLKLPSYFAYGECDFESQVYKTYGFPKSRQLEGLKGIVSVSGKNTKELEALGIVKGVPILTAPNATDLSLFQKLDRKECREKLGMPLDRFIVGFVGGFIERKGDKRLLAAAEQSEDIYLAFAGRGENPPSGDRVVFCRAMEHKDICLFLNAIDVFCLPTLSEGSCNAVIEAMACGCPIVSSDLPFNDDVLTAENSVRIDPNSVDQIRDAIERLRSDPAFRETLANNALACSKELDIAQRAKKILSFISVNNRKSRGDLENI